MFTKGFRRGPLRIQMVQNLQEQEMSLLPATMVRLAETKRHEAYAATYQEVGVVLKDLRNIFHTADIAATAQTLLQLQQRMKELRPDGPLSDKKAATVAVRTIKCPTTDCRGFIPTSGLGANTCAICEVRVCRECNDSLSPGSGNHTCDPDAVASWALIRDTSVACPKCGTPIQKVSGCNQMWCTVPNCNTSFDWATGRVVNGPVHNPHYHEWLRLGGVAPQQANLACDVGPRQIFTYERFSVVYNLLDETMGNDPNYQLVCQYLRALPEAVYYTPDPVNYEPMLYEDLRIKYLEETITKAQWASKLSHRETLRIKNQRLHAITRMFYTASADLFLQLVSELQNAADTNGTVTRLKKAQPTARNQHGRIQMSVQCLLPMFAKPAIDHFLVAMESLRQYHMREVAKMYSDYSDRYARVLESGNTGSLRWSLVPIHLLRQEEEAPAAAGASSAAASMDV